MCMPCHSTVKIVALFKSIEWLFVLWLAIIIASIPYVKSLVQWKIKCLNWFLNKQGIEGEVSASERTFRIFTRDLWILVYLLIVVIILIEIIK